MTQIERITHSGAVLEIEEWPARGTGKKNSQPLVPRFRDEIARLRHNLGISRRWHARLFNANFNEQSLFSTLTFSDEHLPKTPAECIRLRDNFYRKLRWRYPDAVIFIYYGEGRKTNRFHIHMVSNGIPEEVIRKCWCYGEIIKIVHLDKSVKRNGKNYGHDYTPLANYLFYHWRPAYKGHRWKNSRNAKKPDIEIIELSEGTFSKKRFKIPKGYVLVESMETKYGYKYYRYVWAGS